MAVVNRVLPPTLTMELVYQRVPVCHDPKHSIHGPTKQARCYYPISEAVGVFA